MADTMSITTQDAPRNDAYKMAEDQSEAQYFYSAVAQLATPIGIFVILFYAIKITFNLVRCLRLYFISQTFGRSNKFKLKDNYGKWAVISGSTSGIGLALAKELARSGMSIVIIEQDEARLAKTKASLEEETNSAVEIDTVRIDLSDPSLENFDSIRPLINPNNRDIGILINNVGIYPIGNEVKHFHNFHINYACQMVNLNILAALHLTRMIMPGMLDRGRGLIVNVSSIAGGTCVPYLDVYSPTKAFVKSFTRQLQQEYSSHPIDIIDLSPSTVMTKDFWPESKRKTTPNLIMPMPDDYAKSVVNALTCRPKQFCGTFIHEISSGLALIIDQLNMQAFLVRQLTFCDAKKCELSSVTKSRH